MFDLMIGLAFQIQDAKPLYIHNIPWLMASLTASSHNITSYNSIIDPVDFQRLPTEILASCNFLLYQR
jgi:hypothetical protein